MSGKKHHINYTITDIEDYLQGRLSPAEMHAMEKAALQDPFLADALEGLRSADPASTKTDLAAIEAKLLAEEQSNPKLVNAQRDSSWWKIAALIIFMAGAATIGWYVLKQDNGKPELAQQTVATKKAVPDTAVPDTSAKGKISPVSPRKEIARLKQEAAEKNERAAVTLREENEKRSAEAADMAATAKRSIERRSPAVPDSLPPANNIAADRLSPVLEGKVAGVSVQGQQRSHSFKGVVVDSNLLPIPNASILVKDKQGVAVDEKGNYSFKSDNSRQKVEVSALGFKPKKIELSAKESGKVVLEPEKEELSEVVVTGYGTQRKRDITGAVASTATVKPDTITDSVLPQTGWPALYQHLDSSIQINEAVAKAKEKGQSSTIELEITLDATGKIIDAEVQKIFDRSYSRKLIRVLKKGPVWINADRSIATGRKKIILKF